MHDDAHAAYALLGQPIQQSLSYEQFAEQWQETKAERASQAAQLERALGTSRVGAGAATKGRPADRDRQPGQPEPSARAVVTLPQGAQLILEPASPALALVSGESGARKTAGRAGPAGPAGAGGWRIVDPDLQIIRAPTPEAALRLLLASVEQRSYPALLRLLTKAERQSLEAELDERIERLRASLARGQAAAGSSPAPGQGSTTATSSPASATASSAGSGSASGSADGQAGSDHVRIQYDPRFFIDLRREQDSNGNPVWRIADFN